MISAPDFSKKQIITLIPRKGDKLTYRNDNLVIKDADGKTKFQCTCYQIFAIFIMGHVSITSGILMRARKFGYSICLCTESFRPYHVLSGGMEGNTLLVQKQYQYAGLDIARFIVVNKIRNQTAVLNRIRKKPPIVTEAVTKLSIYADEATTADLDSIHNLMGIEGSASRTYFKAMYESLGWKGRKPRTKCDYINSTLDIGYTILFNFIECVLRIFGFDIYKGFLHQEFYMRKSLVCDIVEPFRPLIDWEVRCGINLGEIKEDDFIEDKGRFLLKYENNAKYSGFFTEKIMEHKMEIFRYIQSFYRAFMKDIPISSYDAYNI